MPGRGDSRVAGRALRSGVPWVVLAAILFWAVALPQAERSVFGRVPVLDEVYYLDRAAEPAAPEGHFVSPLYPRLISLMGSGLSPGSALAAPADLRGIRLLQILCWLGTVLLLRALAGRIFPARPDGWRGGVMVWLPSALFALYLPAAVYSLAILLETPQVFLVTLAAWAAVRLLDEPRWWTAVLLGVVLGLAGLLRGTSLVLLPVGLAAAFAADPHRWRLPLLVIVCALAVLIPSSLHNQRATGRFAGPTLNGGVNLAIGNNPEANGFYVAIVPGDWRTDPAGTAYLAVREGRPGLTLGEADQIWRRQATGWMAGNPGRVAALWLKKAWLQLQGWEIDQLTPLGGWTAGAPALRVLVVPYALVVVLAIAGLAAGFGNRRIVLLAAFLVALIVAQSLFFVVSRYRLVLVPLLALLAAGALPGLLALNRRTLVVAAAAILVVVPWGQSGVRAMFARQAAANEALRWSTVGAAEEDARATARAIELLEWSVAEGEGSPAAWLGLAAQYVAQRRWDEAESVLLRGLEYWPRRTELGRQLVTIRLRQDRPRDALAAVEMVLREDPTDGDTLHNATILLARLGRPGEARARAEALIDAHPLDSRGYNDLGILLAREGRTSEAAAIFRRGLAAVPGHPGLTENLSRLEKNQQ